MMGIHTFLSDNEADFDPDDTEKIEVITLPGAPLAMVTMVSPTLVVHNVIRDSYIHRLMKDAGYQEAQP